MGTFIKSVLCVTVFKGFCAEVMANPKQENLPVPPVADPKKSKKTKAYVDTEDMSVNFGTFKLGIPPNFKEVLEALTREILKEQPTDIATFSAIFLNELLEKREQGLDTRFIVKRQEAIAIKSSTSQFMKADNDGAVVPPPTKPNSESTPKKESTGDEVVVGVNSYPSAEEEEEDEAKEEPISEGETEYATAAPGSNEEQNAEDVPAPVEE